MVISREKINKIRALIVSKYNSLIFKLTGKSILTDEEIQKLFDDGLIDVGADTSLIKEGYYIGRARNTLDPRLRDNMTLNQFNRDLRHQGEPLNDKQLFAIEHIENSTGNLLAGVRDATKTTIEHIINQQNIDFRNESLDNIIRPILVEGIKKQRSIQQIAKDLRDATGDNFRNFKRVVVTELTNAMNLGEADAIIERNKGVSLDNIYVYKRVNKDNGTCEHCKKAYLLKDSLIPRVFTMAELQANGSNYGKKANY